jgi:hypothetical protein
VRTRSFVLAVGLLLLAVFSIAGYGVNQAFRADRAGCDAAACQP